MNTNRDRQHHYYFYKALITNVTFYRNRKCNHHFCHDGHIYRHFIKAIFFLGKTRRDQPIDDLNAIGFEPLLYGNERYSEEPNKAAISAVQVFIRETRKGQ